ncbi:MAG: MBL fold metallo-hydrolase [Candidatus Hydrogenedentes bacterium]|nr:MBL fold metallo-hydrolase [Candidatus Hydrogenedentota bacterium]
MIVYQFCSSINEANLYLLVEEDSKDALIIDMPEWCEGLDSAIRESNAKVKAIFITHSHYDHTSGLNYLPKSYDSLQKYPSKHFFENENSDNFLLLGRYEGKIISVPGHTDDSVVLFFPSAGILFTGDALFAGSVGGTVGEREYKKQQKAIKEKLLVLPEDTIIFPGHGPVSSVGIEKKYNPFLI